ncbi:MAG: ABC transporter permease [candidate division Zixibacteria bacterium]|nr:ABC transporter permease [candidate division Zixibacteria bacterium]
MKNLAEFLIQLYRFSVFLKIVFQSFFKRPIYFKETVEQLYQIGYKSLPIVTLTALFTGMVVAFQTGTEMSRFGAKAYIGSVVAVSLVRELGPVLTALVVAGRVGAGITAELGSMQVTDQINAMRAMATDPYKKLVLTRIAALLIILPILVIIADVLGIFGGAFIATTNLNVGLEMYRSTIVDAVFIEDLYSGLTKPFVFAFIIGTIGCYLGMNASGGTKGVGNSTTLSVVISSVLIFLFDFILTKFFFMMGRPV